MQAFLHAACGVLYRRLLKPLLFLHDPEKVHERVTAAGERLGDSPAARRVISACFQYKHPSLSQSRYGLTFANPVGLSAGFDYEARLTQALPAVGFGFGTVGTVTRMPYGGNPRPMLGRLPQSRSLMVNKGFKNLGIAETLRRLAGKTFAYPVGVSIGKTNTADITTQEAGIRDIVESFRMAEQHSVPFAYYELNISCPNLVGSVEFYHPRHLQELLDALTPLALSRPVFVKMPISKTDDEIRAMMDVIVRYPWIRAVILGNLQRDRTHPTLVPKEVQRFDRGNFSGLPCQARSDELISLVYRSYGHAMDIIGCGGIFSAGDAYRKIKRGATLVQLITGLVFEGPQLVSRINRDFVHLLQRDGYSSIAEAVGVDAAAG